MLPKPPPREGQLGFLHLPPYRLQGLSVAGEQTVLQIPELDVVFDMGHCTRPSLASPTVVLSHAHMDHIGALPYWLSQRHFQKLGTGRVICHPEIAPALERMMASWVDLERQKTPHEIVPIASGAEIPLKRNVVLRAFDVDHGCPAMGFAIVEYRSKLREEFRDLPQDRLRELRERDVEITRTTEIPLVAYTGDTAPCDVLERPEFRDARLVVTECTFFDPEHRERARFGNHLHVDDLARYAETWNAKDIVVVHVTRRTMLSAARKALDEIGGGAHAERLHLLMDMRTNRRRYERQLAEVQKPEETSGSAESASSG